MANTTSRKPVRSKASNETAPGPGALEHQLYQRVAQILEETRGQVARTVNSAMVHAYWQVGREIVEVEQAGELRAGYGDELIARLSVRLKAGSARGSAFRTFAT